MGAAFGYRVAAPLGAAAAMLAALGWCGGGPRAAGQDTPPKYSYAYGACDTNPISCADCIGGMHPASEPTSCGVMSFGASDTKVKVCQQVTSQSSTCSNDAGEVDSPCAGGTYWACHPYDPKTKLCTLDPGKCKCGLVTGGISVPSPKKLNTCAK